MNKKRTLKSIFGVALSNCTVILSGLVIGFLIPKIFSVEDYGLYKTFTLYATYIGLFSFGIIDGIVLEYGMCDYAELNKCKFRSYFKWYVLVHCAAAIVLSLIGLIFGKGDHQFILVMLSLDLLAVNVTGYYQQISQFTQRFHEYSVRKALQSAFDILIVLFLFLFYVRGNNVSYQTYVICLVTVNTVLTAWYIYSYREISIGESASMICTGADILHLTKIGFPLLFANLCSTLILTLDRQFVNLFFSNAEYAVYSFAYNMLSLVTVATSAISTVLYPLLMRTSKENLQKNYTTLIGTILIFVYAALIAYFPLYKFVEWFLPKYVGSLVIFRVIFPGLAISSVITVVMHNYYKTLGDNLLYFKKSVLILCLSVLANGIAYVLFKTTVSISIASIATMVFWYLYIEQYFVKNYGYRRAKNLLYMIVMMAVFYTITTISNWIVSGLTYLVLFGIITTVIHKDTLYQIKGMLNERKDT